MEGIKICILTSVHPARDIRIYEKEAKALAKAGYQVCLLNPYESADATEGITLVKVDAFAQRMPRILFSWLVFMQAALKQKPKLVHFHDPELIPAALLLKLFGKRVIYDVHEDLPRQILYKNYLAPKMRKLLSVLAERWEGAAARCFDANICATPTIAKRFKKAMVVYNYPLLRELETYGQHLLPYHMREDKLCYVGAIDENRGIFNILDAVQGTALKVVLAGKLDDEALGLLCKRHPGHKNVQYLGYQSREEVMRLMGQSKVGLLLLNPTENYLHSLPIKLFEYLMCKTPVICSDFPEWRALFGQTVLYVNPKNAQQVQEAAQSLLEDSQQAEQMAEEGQKLVLERFTFEGEEGKLLKLYKNLLDRQGNAKR